MTTALHRGGPSSRVVGSSSLSSSSSFLSIDSHDLQRVLRQVVHRGNTKSPKATAVRLTCMYIDQLRLSVAESDWAKVSHVLRTKRVPHSGEGWWGGGG
jgi:hypothetical protein